MKCAICRIELGARNGDDICTECHRWRYAVINRWINTLAIVFSILVAVMMTR